MVYLGTLKFYGFFLLSFWSINFIISSWTLSASSYWRELNFELPIFNNDLLWLFSGTFPIDLAKTRLQIQGQKHDIKHAEVKYRGMTDAFLQISKQEGLLALYSGYWLFNKYLFLDQVESFMFWLVALMQTEFVSGPFDWRRIKLSQNLFSH